MERLVSKDLDYLKEDAMLPGAVHLDEGCCGAYDIVDDNSQSIHLTEEPIQKALAIPSLLPF